MQALNLEDSLLKMMPLLKNIPQKNLIVLSDYEDTNESVGQTRLMLVNARDALIPHDNGKWSRVLLKIPENSKESIGYYPFPSSMQMDT